MTLAAISLTPEQACLPQDASLLDALKFMLEYDVNHVPLCHAGKWVGLVSIGHVLEQILPISVRMDHGLSDLAFAGDARSLLSSHIRQLAERRAVDSMDPNLPVLRESDGLLESALLLFRHETPLPVLDANGMLKGMLSRRALLDHLMKMEG